MTRTQLINVLKSIEFSASGRPREVSVQIGKRFIPSPLITIDSTGDGIAGAEVCIKIER